MDKSPDAFRTISEVADWLGIQAHVLRFWESKFTQVKPVKRAGGRRYYRPADMMLLGGIKKLLHEDGMTIKGVQKVLREQGVQVVSDLSQSLDDVAVSAGRPRRAHTVVPFQGRATLLDTARADRDPREETSRTGQAGRDFGQDDAGDVIDGSATPFESSPPAPHDREAQVPHAQLPEADITIPGPSDETEASVPEPDAADVFAQDRQTSESADPESAEPVMDAPEGIAPESAKPEMDAPDAAEPSVSEVPEMPEDGPEAAVGSPEADPEPVPTFRRRGSARFTPMAAEPEDSAEDAPFEEPETDPEADPPVEAAELADIPAEEPAEAPDLVSGLPEPEEEPLPEPADMADMADMAEADETDEAPQEDPEPLAGSEPEAEQERAEPEPEANAAEPEPELAEPEVAAAEPEPASAPRPAIVDAPDPPDESEIAADPGLLSQVSRIGRLPPAQREEIAALAEALEAWRAARTGQILSQ